MEIRFGDVQQAFAVQDPQLTGKIAPEDFKRALKQLEPKLSLYELDTIAQHYSVTDRDPRNIKYILYLYLFNAI